MNREKLDVKLINVKVAVPKQKFGHGHFLNAGTEKCC